MTTLVMVPGLGSDGSVWKRTIDELDGRVSCLVGDTRKDESLSGMARRVLDNAPERFALAGVSMGGMIALEMMRTAPERVTRLALVDTMARPDTVTQKAFRYLSNLVVVVTGDFKRLSEYSVGSLVHPSASAEIRAELVEMGVRVGAHTYMQQNRALMARGDLRSVLPRIAVPTVVIVGAEDRLTPVEMSQEIHALIPKSTLQVIADCGHLPPIEKPETMAKMLLELIE